MVSIARSPSHASPTATLANSACQAAWHATFVDMLPTIVAQARFAFRQLNPEAREEAIQEVVCNACQSFSRLDAMGKQAIVYPTPLARYGIAHARQGRKVGSRLCIRDVMSVYCQRRKGINVERLDFVGRYAGWRDAVVQDTRNSPAPDIVSFRVDFAAWLRGLPRRDRRIAKALAMGDRTSEVSQRFHLSAARVSQLRRELSLSWRQFQGEAAESGRATA
jgi:hypothetical protein